MGLLNRGPLSFPEKDIWLENTRNIDIRHASEMSYVVRTYNGKHVKPKLSQSTAHPHKDQHLV